jgi:hypothetical protein
MKRCKKCIPKHDQISLSAMTTRAAMCGWRSPASHVLVPNCYFYLLDVSKAPRSHLALAPFRN